MQSVAGGLTTLMYFKLVSLFCFGIGIFVLVQVGMPLLEFKVWEISSYNQNVVLADPNPENEAVLGVSVSSRNDFPAIISTNLRENKPQFSEFSLSISRIGVFEAKTVVETNDFEQNLAHLPGSALPGERGNVFVTGHSAITQLFKPGNYKAIFANLPNIKKGDEITINAAGSTYRYMVEGLKIVNPKEVWVVNPPDSMGRYLTLMTCVPPGFNTKRLIVLAKLI